MTKRPKPAGPSRKAEALARDIARRLFTRANRAANRLVLEFSEQPTLNGPGWCSAAVEDQIIAALRAAAKVRSTDVTTPTHADPNYDPPAPSGGSAKDGTA